MHLFLTGEIQVGKSTILRRWLREHPGLRVGGFRTVAGDLDGSPGSSVHIIPAASDVPLTADNRVLTRPGPRGGMGFRPYPDVFDKVGTVLLEQSRGSDLILMDEIGTCENEAEAFRRAVLARLDEKTPVLGVVQLRRGVLPDLIRAHPGVTVLTVTVRNRESVLEQLLNTDILGGKSPDIPGAAQNL